MDKAEVISLCVTLGLIVLDYLTGLAKAVHAGTVSSEKMREGLWHKSAYVIVLVLAEIIEHAQTYMDLGFSVPLLVPAIVYISVTEIASILENLTEINPELANSKLLALFASSKGDNA